MNTTLDLPTCNHVHAAGIGTYGHTHPCQTRLTVLRDALGLQCEPTWNAMVNSIGPIPRGSARREALWQAAYGRAQTITLPEMSA